ncbi:UDP-glycosyltransferase UGT5 [Drosophila sulfurigaster albostrigata]|uniref:UDP-glycosyltransferase UGT5 n=1 Tax=Drosophila sulfurigaster albostrigata TaxID=89887 RepID=UPI002D21EE5A|nr:UDP-glycosyltransferase UGT5 [Drosophila sulfurigaster albostrigata]
MTTQYYQQARLIVLGLCLTTLIGDTSAGNILAVFPHFGFSHFKVVQPLLSELAQRGHHVTVISYVNNPLAAQLPNYEQLLTSDANEDQASTTINVVPLTEHTPTRSLPVLLKEYYDLFSEGQTTCGHLYASGHVATVLERHKEQPYDLLLTEYFSNDCQLALAKLMQLPIIGVSTCALMPYFYDRIDLPDNPAYVLSEFVGFAQPLLWHERLLNFVQAKLLKLLYKLHTNRADQKLIKQHLGIDIDVDEVARDQTAFILVNQHYSHMGSRPVTPQLIEVGGMHITSDAKKQLPQELEQFLQRSPQGVIFISWGSMVRASSIDADKLQAMLQVLSQQPLNVIWKWETDEHPQVDANKFLFVKWAPQLALLCQPRVKLFWAHAGLLGMTEALHCGKPLLMTPIYGDQFLNAYAAQQRGIGLKLDYEQINVTTLQETLQELSHANYAVGAEKLSQVFNGRQRTPIESAIWSVEHVLQHGLFATKLLQSPGIELNWFIYHSLDSIAILLVLVLLIIASWRALFPAQSKRQSKAQTQQRAGKKSRK